MSEKQFCELLKAAIIDEEKAVNEYLELHSIGQEIGLPKIDAHGILHTAMDEQKHALFLKKLFKRCE